MTIERRLFILKHPKAPENSNNQLSDHLKQTDRLENFFTSCR